MHAQDLREAEEKSRRLNEELARIQRKREEQLRELEEDFKQQKLRSEEERKQNEKKFKQELSEIERIKKTQEAENAARMAEAERKKQENIRNLQQKQRDDYEQHVRDMQHQQQTARQEEAVLNTKFEIQRVTHEAETQAMQMRIDHNKEQFKEDLNQQRRLHDLYKGQ